MSKNFGYFNTHYELNKDFLDMKLHYGQNRIYFNNQSLLKSID